MKLSDLDAKPWYREPWPWLLMSGPAIVVVAGIFTAVLAVRTHDGLVVDDYYKQGLAVNKDLSRGQAARAAGYQAEVTIDAQKGQALLTMPNMPTDVNNLVLTLSRATTSGSDRHIALQRRNSSDPTTFIGSIIPPTPLEAGKWYVMLDDSSQHWRLLTNITLQHATPITFSLGSAAVEPTLKP